MKSADMFAVLLDRIEAGAVERAALQASVASAALVEAGLEAQRRSLPACGDVVEFSALVEERDRFRAELAQARADVDRLTGMIVERDTQITHLTGQVSELCSAEIKAWERVSELEQQIVAMEQTREQLVWQAETTAMGLDRPVEVVPSTTPSARSPSPNAMHSGRRKSEVVIEVEPIREPVTGGGAVAFDIKPELSGAPEPERVQADVTPASTPESVPPAAPSPPQGERWTKARRELLQRRWTTGMAVGQIALALNATLDAGETPFTEHAIRVRAGLLGYKRPTSDAKARMEKARAGKTVKPAHAKPAPASAMTTAVTVVAPPPEPRPLSDLAQRHGQRAIELDETGMTYAEIAEAINVDLKVNDHVNAAMVRKILVETRAFEKAAA